MAALLLAFCSVPAVAQTPVERHGQLQVQGNRIVDQRGEPVVLRGMSLFWRQWAAGILQRHGILDDKETRLWWDFMERNTLSYLNWSVAEKPETSAALRPGASGKGGWPLRMLSPSGRFVRDHLRKMNPKGLRARAADPCGEGTC
ncbi:MAG: hypothetical protein M3Q08_09900 [Pseudomonadota bacterium]|nr:hypothetical protein [Pseudomonadota bacterium]